MRCKKWVLCLIKRVSKCPAIWSPHLIRGCKGTPPDRALRACENLCEIGWDWRIMRYCHVPAVAIPIKASPAWSESTLLAMPLGSGSHQDNRSFPCHSANHRFLGEIWVPDPQLDQILLIRAWQHPRQPNGTSQNNRNLATIPQRNGHMLDQLMTITLWHNKMDFGQVQSHSKHSVKEPISFSNTIVPKQLDRTTSIYCFGEALALANPQISVDANLFSPQRPGMFWALWR